MKPKRSSSSLLLECWVPWCPTFFNTFTSTGFADRWSMFDSLLNIFHFSASYRSLHPQALPFLPPLEATWRCCAATIRAHRTSQASTSAAAAAISVGPSRSCCVASKYHRKWTCIRRGPPVGKLGVDPWKDMKSDWSINYYHWVMRNPLHDFIWS